MLADKTENFKELENNALKFINLIHINNEEKYEEVLQYSEILLDEFNRGNSSVEQLLHIITQEIVNWENQNYKLKELSPVEYLKILMEKHGHKQSDLIDIAVPSTISAILSGKRTLTLKQIKALAKKYKVPIERFISLEIVK